MKKIEAIIRPSKVDPLTVILRDMGIDTLTVSYAAGCGNQKRIDIYRGKQQIITLIAKMKVEVEVADKDIGKVVWAIEQTAMTGKIGDGKIIISKIEAVLDNPD